MRIHQVIAIVLGVFFISGCGDQFWCGEDGCPGKSMTLSSGDPATIKAETVRTSRVML